MSFVNLPVPSANPIFPSSSLIKQVAQPNVPVFTLTKYANLVVQGNYAYAISGGNPGLTLSVFDITDNSNSKAIGYLTTGSVHWSPPSYPGFLNGGYNLVADDRYLYIASSGSNYFYVVDISNPFNPFVLSGLAITGSPGSLYGISYLGGYCYLATQNTGLVVVDIGGGTGSPSNPIQVFQEGGSVKSFGVFATVNGIFTTQYSTSNPFTTRQIKSWAITGLGSKGHPVLTQSLQVTTAGEALGITVYNNNNAVPPVITAYVSVITSGVNNINIIDVTNPASMTNIAQVSSNNTFNSAFVAQQNNNLLYIPSGSNATYGGAVDIYDISVRSSPVHKSQIKTNVPNSIFGGIVLSNGYIYCADYGVAPGSSGTLDIFTQPNTNLNGIP